MEQYLHRAFDRIGSDKVMWGTDIPGLFNSADYPQLLSMGSLHSRILGGKDQENFLSGTALKIFGS
jgi:predicted TIM-barrel fold metal-dependent hydrolase